MSAPTPTSPRNTPPQTPVAAAAAAPVAPDETDFKTVAAANSLKRQRGTELPSAPPRKKIKAIRCNSCNKKIHPLSESICTICDKNFCGSHLTASLHGCVRKKQDPVSPRQNLRSSSQDHNENAAF